MKQKVYTEKQLNYARRANMFEYMLFRGEGFEQVSGKTFEHVDHDSLRANEKTGVVTWFSQFDEKRNDKLNSFDNSIEFAMRFFGEPFEESVQRLLDFQSGRSIEYTYTPKRKSTHSKFSLSNLKYKDLGYLTNKGKEYLRSRFISDSTIQWLEENRYLSSDEKNNILAKWYEFVPNGKEHVVGADTIGIYRKPVEARINKKDLENTKLDRATFKGIAEASKYTGGFFLSNGLDFTGSPTLFVYEAPLEALSYIELYKDRLPKNSFFHSMSGYKWLSVEDRIKEIQAAYPEETKVTVVVAVNNDEPGHEFVEGRLNAHDESKYTLKVHFPNILDGDWNEELELSKTGKLASRELKQREVELANDLRAKMKQEQKSKGNIEVSSL